MESGLGCLRGVKVSAFYAGARAFIIALASVGSSSAARAQPVDEEERAPVEAVSSILRDVDTLQQIADFATFSKMTFGGLINAPVSSPLHGIQFGPNGEPQPFNYGRFVGSVFRLGSDGDGERRWK